MIVFILRYKQVKIKQYKIITKYAFFVYLLQALTFSKSFNYIKSVLDQNLLTYMGQYSSNTNFFFFYLRLDIITRLVIKMLNFP